MIQEIAPHSFSNSYCPAAADADAPVLCYTPGEVLCAEGSELRLPRLCELGLAPEDVRFAFTIDGQAFFLAKEQISAPAGFSMRATRPLRNAEPRQLAWAMGVGESLWRWYRANRFCGACGTPMDDSREERARVCPGCSLIRYPKICPAVITAVTDGDRLLLTRYANRPFRSYALVAGFNEIGESIEDTVRREVMEETGLRVKNLRFYRSQPWVFTDSLLMGFFAELDGSDEIVLQETELAEAQWFSRDALPADHSAISLTGEMIELFRTGGEPRR